MQKIPKREYTAELKEQAVKRVKDGKSKGTAAPEVQDDDRDHRSRDRQALVKAPILI